MKIDLQDLEFLENYEGNGVNKIYKVKKISSQEIFVLKVIKIKNLKHQIQEIKSHKKLNHKYIIKLIDYEVQDSKLLILLEHAEYGDLFKFFKYLKNFNEKQLLTLYFKIVQSVNYLHSLKLVHRDIKPENVMINKKVQPKLGDFGTIGEISKIQQTFCGTYEYMAPEIYLRTQQTEKVDIWALGVLFYEMTHFKTPFKNDSLDQIQQKIKNQKIQFKSNFPKKFQKFIYDLLKVNPLHRPSSKNILKHEIFDILFDKNQSINKNSVKNEPKTAPSSNKEIQKVVFDQGNYFVKQFSIFFDQNSNKNLENVSLYSGKTFSNKNIKNGKKLSKKNLEISNSKLQKIKNGSLNTLKKKLQKDNKNSLISSNKKLKKLIPKSTSSNSFLKKSISLNNLKFKNQGNKQLSIHYS